MISNVWIAVLVFYPMVGALISYLVGKKSKTARNMVANFITISEFALTVYVVISQYASVIPMVGEEVISSGRGALAVGTYMNAELTIPEVWEFISYWTDSAVCMR